MNILRARWLLGSLASLVAACSGNSSPPPQASTAAAAAAASENVLNIYNWSDFIGPSIISDFEKESGIKVHYDVYESNEMMEVKLLSGHTNYDIVVPGGSFFEREVKAGVYPTWAAPRHLMQSKAIQCGGILPLQAKSVIKPG